MRCALMMALVLAAGCARFERGAPSEDATPDAGSARDAAVDPGAPSFEAEVLPTLLSICGPCHGPGGPRRAALALDGVAAQDYETIVALSDEGEPEASRLLRTVTGNDHARVISPGSADYQLIVAWMAGGVQP